MPTLNPWSDENQGDVDLLLEERVPMAVVPYAEVVVELLAVIRNDDHERAIGQAQLLEASSERTDIRIGSPDIAVIEGLVAGSRS